MDPFVDTQLTVSNLTPVWEGATMDGGGSFAPTAAEHVVERAVGTRATDVAPVVIDRPNPYSAPILDEAAHRELDLPRPMSFVDGLGPEVDYEALGRRDIARELLRARLVAIAEQREHRSAYEIAFILLAAAVAVLLAAPPLVQVLLAARGIQA